MKKALAYMMTLFLLLGACTFPAAAEEKFDSLNIPKDELQLLETELEKEPENTVVKLYRTSPMRMFSQKSSIEAILGPDQEVYEVYLIKTIDNTKFMQMYEGKMARISSMVTALEIWVDFVEYALEPSKVFDETVKVLNIYCLMGTAVNDGGYIYYVTDKGDYVLYKSNMTLEIEPLMPVADFYEIAQKVCEENDLAAAMGWDCGNAAGEFNSSELSSRPERNSLFIIAAVISGVIIVGGGTFGLVFWFKIKKRKNV